MKSYGRAPAFLALTGYEQVRPVVTALADTAEPGQESAGDCFGPTAPALIQLGAPGPASDGC